MIGQCTLHGFHKPISAQETLRRTVERKFRCAFVISRVLFLGMPSFFSVSTALIWRSSSATSSSNTVYPAFEGDL